MSTKRQCVLLAECRWPSSVWNHPRYSLAWVQPLASDGGRGRPPGHHPRTGDSETVSRQSHTCLWCLQLSYPFPGQRSHVPAFFICPVDQELETPGHVLLEKSTLRKVTQTALSSTLPTILTKHPEQTDLYVYRHEPSSPSDSASPTPLLPVGAENSQPVPRRGNGEYLFTLEIPAPRRREWPTVISFPDRREAASTGPQKVQRVTIPTGKTWEVTIPESEDLKYWDENLHLSS